MKSKKVTYYVYNEAYLGQLVDQFISVQHRFILVQRCNMINYHTHTRRGFFLISSITFHFQNEVGLKSDKIHDELKTNVSYTYHWNLLCYFVKVFVVIWFF